MAAPVLPVSESVTIDIPASAEALWPVVVDAATPARFSREVEASAYAPGQGAALGSTIVGENVRGEVRWSTTSTVTEFEPPRRFAWATGGVEHPTATWSFAIDPTERGSRLTHTVTLHEGQAPLAPAIERDPERAHEIVAARLAEIVANMRDTIAGIAGLF